MSAPTGGGDNGLSLLQQLLSAGLSVLRTGWLPASGPGPEAALAAAATPLAQAAQIFSGAATQAGHYNPPVSSYTAIRGIAVGAITQASQDLQNAAASLSSFAQAATQWLNSSSSPPPPALSFHTGSATGAPPAVPQAGVFTGGPLTTCLIGVLTTLYKSITDVNASLDVINSAPQGDPAPGTDPASALITGLDTLAALLATAGTYTASIGSSIHDAATQHSTALSDIITDVNTLAAQVIPGRVPSDPDTLASILSRISAVRAVVWPSPGSFTDQTAILAYYEYTEWLIYAMQTALSATTAVSSAPAALVPFRLETRLTPQDSGVTLRVRIFPDDIAVNAHDPALTPEEAAAAVSLQVATQTADQDAASVWAQAAGAFGAGRAAYLNLVQLPGRPPPRDAAGAEPTPRLDRGRWPAPAQCYLLPDRWLAVVYGFDEQIPMGAAISGPVRRPLQVGPDLRPGAGAAGQLGVDTALEWMVDFQAATDAGMAVTITLDGLGGQRLTRLAPQAPDVPVISRVVVVGLQTPAAASTPADLLAQTLAAHRFTDGLEILAPGTPTNNLTGTSSAYRNHDPGYADSFAREVAIPQSWAPPYTVSGDASRLAAALGIPASTFAGAGQPRNDALDAQAMAAITWHASGATILPWLGITDPTVTDAARAWVSAYVSPGGPLPAIRAGIQPYGVLPVTSYSPNATDLDPIARAVARAISAMLPHWKSSGITALQQDMFGQLQRTPIATSFIAGLAVANDPTVTVHTTGPSWLPDGHGLMTFHPDDVAGAVQTTSQSESMVADWLTGGTTLPQLPSQMGLFASEGSGQPGWALTGSPDATPARQQSFLASLSTTGPVTPPAVPQPDTLLTALANHAWINTPGVSTAADSPLQRRGLLPEGQSASGAPAPAATELRAATGYLARPGIDIDAVLGGAMDIVSHRLDAWATGLAVARLAAVQARPATGPTMVIGGYGIVENLVMSSPFDSAGMTGDPTVVVDPSNDGYLAAPGLAQAVTAAVLRGGYLNHAPAAAADRSSGAGSAPFAVDLSSRRARTAQWLLDGMRKGQPLGALLGYRFERRLIKDGLGTLVTQFRQVAPLDRAANQDPNVDVTAQPAPPISARGTDVADGVTLHAIWQAQQAATKAAGATANSFTEPATQPAFLELDDALDAVTDAITATAVHQALNGDTSAAAASLDSVMHGTVTADPSGFLRTPRTGTAIIQRVLLPVSAAPLPAGWTDTPRGQAEPALSAWVASLLPAPSSMVVLSGVYTSASGASLPNLAPVTLDLLNIGPLDFLTLAQRPNELRQLAVHHALSQPDLPPDTGVQPAGPASGSGPYGYALDIAGSLSSALASARPADARDLTSQLSGSAGVDQADLDARVAAATTALDAALTACAAALPAVPAPGTGPRPVQLPTSAGAGALVAALQTALRLGIPGAAPVSGPDTIDLLASQVYTAWAALLTRQSAAAQAAASSNRGPSDAQQLQAALAQLAAIFGQDFPVIPRVAALSTAMSQTPAAISDLPAAHDPLAWLVKASKTRQPIADILTAITGAEASGVGTVELSVTVAQDPSGGPWAGGTLPQGTDPSSLTGVLCLTFIGADIPATSTTATPANGGLVLADWTEAIPSAQETAAIAYQFNAPPAQAPQAVLLAVPADPSAQEWTWSDLATTVTDTIDLAYSRAFGSTDMVDGSDLLRPAMYVAAQPPAEPPIRGSYQPSYMAFTQQATITGLTAAPGPGPVPSLTQGQTATFAVTGTTLTGLTADAISVVSADQGISVESPAFDPAITVESYTPSATTPDTAGTLTLSAATDAQPGGRALRAGFGDPSFTLFTVTPRAQAQWCDTALIHQGYAAQAVTVAVHGYGLTGAAVQVDNGGAVVTGATVIQSSDNVLSINLGIAACAYKAVVPGPLGLPFPNPVPPKHVALNTALVVTPPGGGGIDATTFSITIDTLV